MDYGKNLKLARKWAGLTQAALADKAGIATITIRQYEAGKRKPSMENWFAIADALHLSLDELNNAELLPTEPFDPDDIPPDFETEEQTVLFNDLIQYFSLLNTNGQAIAVERIKELTKILDYQAEKEPPQPE